MLTQKLMEFSSFGAEWVVWLLVAMSVVSLGLLFDRILLFAATRERLAQLEPALIGALGRGDVAAAQAAVRGDSLIRNVLRAGLGVLASGKRDAGSVEQAMLGALARERERFERRLAPLGTIGTNAPFLGLLGTVLGIIEAFAALGVTSSAAAAASNQQLISAIGEALITTGLGILVAIPAVSAFNWARAAIDARTKHAEALMRALLSGLGNVDCAPLPPPGFVPRAVERGAAAG